MLSIEISSRGVELKSLAEKFPANITQKFIEQLAQETQNIMVLEAPRRSGRLMQSIIKEVSEFEASIGPQVAYAVYVELGSSPHQIRPLRGKVLAFEGTTNKLVFTAVANHPGTEANPFVKRTGEQITERASAVFADVWRLNNEVL